MATKRSDFDMKTGFDLSSHQGAIDWPGVKSDFAVIRAGWSWYQGGMNIDQRFLENVSGARAAGIPWGAYLYAYDKSPEAAAVSAGKLADLLDQYQIPYPVVYDFEDPQYYSMGRSGNTAICRVFLEALQKRGYYAMLYTFTSFAMSYLEMDKLAEFDLWIADHTGKVGWPGAYGMWQYTDAGSVPGVSGPVDLDRAYKDYPAIIRRAGLNGYGERGETAALRQENEALQKRLDTAEEKLAAVREIVGGEE